MEIRQKETEKGKTYWLYINYWKSYNQMRPSYNTKPVEVICSEKTEWNEVFVNKETGKKIQRKTWFNLFTTKESCVESYISKFKDAIDEVTSTHKARMNYLENQIKDAEKI